MEQEHAASLTARAAKAALPARAILTKEARATLNSCASVFTLYLSAVAQEAATAGKRQTVALRDVLQALRDMDFDQLAAPVELCVQETKAAAALKRSRAAGSAAEAEAEAEEAEEEAGEEEAEEDEAMESAEEPTEAENTEEEDEGEAKRSEPMETEGAS